MDGGGAAPITVTRIPLLLGVDPVADVLCRDKTRLVQRIEDNLTRCLTTALGQHSGELAKAKTIRDAAAARASSLSK